MVAGSEVTNNTKIGFHSGFVVETYFYSLVIFVLIIFGTLPILIFVS